MALMGGANLHNDAFFRKMGQAGLHHFVEGFRANGVHKMSQLQSKSIQQIQEISKKINMPEGAVDRLLAMLKKKKSGGSKPAAKPAAKKKTKKHVAERPKPVSTEEAVPLPTTNTTAGKATDSTYYHFSSTPKAHARQFDAVKVEDANAAAWKTNSGSSSWNPGNTVEERDFSKQAKDILKENLLNYNFENGIVIKKVSKTDGDFSVIASRGKVKTIFDLSFECEWEGTAGEDKIKGTLKCSDIMADEDVDDWYIECKPKKKNAKSKEMNNYVKSRLPYLKEEAVDALVAQIRSFVHI